MPGKRRKSSTAHPLQTKRASTHRAPREPMREDPPPTSKWLPIVAVIILLSIGGAVFVFAFLIPAQKAAAIQHDLEQIRQMSNAMTLYYKKYNYFPALVNMSAPDTTSINLARSPQPHAAALRLLLEGGFVADPKTFFSPLRPAPTDKTLSAMAAAAKVAPPTPAPWAGNYAYDPGHNPHQHSTPIFGTAKQYNEGQLHLLSGELITFVVEGNQSTAILKSHAAGSNQVQPDDIYADDSGMLGWNDAYLKCDIPENLE